MKTMSWALALIWLASVASVSAMAAPPASRRPAQADAPAPREATRAETLDMDAELIERETKPPPLMLDVDTSALDAAIFKRSDFNEFHAIDSARRLRYQAPIGDVAAAPAAESAAAPAPGGTDGAPAAAPADASKGGP